jgi:hypothetical protein
MGGKLARSLNDTGQTYAVRQPGSLTIFAPNNHHLPPRHFVYRRQATAHLLTLGKAVAGSQPVSRSFRTMLKIFLQSSIPE